MTTVGVVGGAGYIGGEVMRLVDQHPRLRLAAATSTRLAGRRVDVEHPQLRGRVGLRYVLPTDLPDVDVLFLTASQVADPGARADLVARGKLVIDLSPDLRLHDAEAYRRHYGEHPAPELLGTATPGLPELHREQLRTADSISVPGCMATAAVLALTPVARLVEPRVTIDGRVGSSGSGASAGAMNLHAERSGVLRVFSPLDHRHQAEVSQHTGLSALMTATGVDAVRGVQVVCRATLREPMSATDLHRAYREHYATEPFVRVVTHKRGNYRLPEPKLLYGTNFCDVGFAVAPDRQLVVLGALDNLVKGGAGNAVQSVNLRMGWPEDLGLGFAGLHPL